MNTKTKAKAQIQMITEIKKWAKPN